MLDISSQAISQKNYTKQNMIQCKNHNFYKRPPSSKSGTRKRKKKVVISTFNLLIRNFMILEVFGCSI